MQTLKYDRCKISPLYRSLFSTTSQIFFFYNSLRTDAIKKSPKCMNETKKSHYKKCSHYIIGASFLIQVFVFVISYYSDMFMISSCWGGGGKNVGYTGWEGQKPGVENREIRTRKRRVHIQPGPFVFKVSMRDLLIPLFSGGSLPLNPPLIHD